MGLLLDSIMGLIRHLMAHIHIYIFCTENRTYSSAPPPRNFPIATADGGGEKGDLQMAGTSEYKFQENEDSFQWDEQSQLYYHARFQIIFFISY